MNRKGAKDAEERIGKNLDFAKETDQPDSNWFELCVLRVFAVQLASSGLRERHWG
jgi:hypothetical protein